MLLSPCLNNTVSQVIPKKEALVNIRIRGNRYYGYCMITDPTTGKKRQIEFSLNVSVGEPRHQTKAIQAFGKEYAKIERGELPNVGNLNFGQISAGWKLNPVSLKGSNHGNEDNLLILDKVLFPFFGPFKVKEITQDLVREHLSLRESLGRKESTLRKELRVLKWVMQSVLKHWEPPFWEFKNKEKEKEEAPSRDDVRLMLFYIIDCSKTFGSQYRDIASIMAYTGLDTSDVVHGLSRESIKNGALIGRRGKTGKRFKIAIPDGLKEILDRLLKIVSIDPKENFFDIPSADAASQAIKKAFQISGRSNFHAKSLRDYYASELYNQKEADNFIQDSLGQVRGSKQTKKYTFASKERLQEVAEKFPDLRVIDPSKKEAIG